MTGLDVVAVNPDTGELLEHLDQQPPETLAEFLDAVRSRQADLTAWGDALEGELRRRLKLRQTRLAVFGQWEVAVDGGRESVWDADQLERAMHQIAGDGVLSAADMADVITRAPTVSRSKAKALLNRLDGEPRALVEQCVTWRDKPGRLTVTRSVQLPTPPTKLDHTELFA